MLKDEFEIEKCWFNSMVEEEEKKGKWKKGVTFMTEKRKNSEQSYRQDREKRGDWMKKRGGNLNIVNERESKGGRVKKKAEVKNNNTGFRQHPLPRSETAAWVRSKNSVKNSRSFKKDGKTQNKKKAECEEDNILFGEPKSLSEKK